VTAETRHHDFSDRSTADARLTPQAAATPITGVPGVTTWGQIPGYPYLNHIFGDAKYTLTTVSFDGGVDVSPAIEVYTFGTYGHRNADSFENYRTPNRLPTIYPLGFSPKETLHEEDYAFTAGIQGKAFDVWNWDLSSTYGQDKDAIGVSDSGNVSLFTDTGFTPTQFHAGDFFSSQWTSNLDIRRAFDAGLTEPINLAFGVEHRREEYRITAGDPASRYKAGSQSYPGFSLTDAGDHSRSDLGAYVDVALNPVDRLKLDLAGRFEHYSDFGNATVGKLTARYELHPAVAVRGTLSTGFRAPTLAEEYYSATNVSPTSANVQLPPNSAAARLIGVENLRSEKSTNYSAGLVFSPISDLHVTLDAYQIGIKNRIVGSGTVYGLGGASNSPAVNAAIAANGNSIDPTVTFVGVQFFTNGLDTRTRGAELGLDYPIRLGSLGRVLWSLNANYNKTDITRIRATPAPIQPQGLFDLASRSYLETASPRYRAVLGALYTWDRVSINVREKLYGEASAYTTPDGGAHYYLNKVGTTFITDLDFSYQLLDSANLSVGSTNLFNHYPAQISVAARGSPGAALYPSFTPYGIDGGYWYGRVTFSF
jgi:iron complex outermembrane receptor protein